VASIVIDRVRQWDVDCVDGAARRATQRRLQPVGILFYISFLADQTDAAAHNDAERAAACCRKYQNNDPFNAAKTESSSSGHSIAVSAARKVSILHGYEKTSSRTNRWAISRASDPSRSRASRPAVIGEPAKENADLPLTNCRSRAGSSGSRTFHPLSRTSTPQIPRWSRQAFINRSLWKTACVSVWPRTVKQSRWADFHVPEYRRVEANTLPDPLPRHPSSRNECRVHALL